MDAEEDVQEEMEGSTIGAEEGDTPDVNVHEGEKNDEPAIIEGQRNPSPSRNERKAASVTKILKRYIKNALA